MAGIVSKPLPSGKYRGWYKDWRGKQIFFRGTTNPKETLSDAKRKEDHHQRIRIGELPAPKESDTPRDFAAVAKEYLAWGAAQGGHGGRKWSPVHVRQRERHLAEFWPARLGLKTLNDVKLAKVEEAARELLAKGKTSKTVQTHVESLGALCLWAKKRGYLDDHPLEGMAPFDSSVKTPRRSLTVNEVEKLLAVAPADRRLLYETAILTGYRKSELTALTVKDLNADMCTLTLRAEYCKGRRDSRQPIPLALALKLKAANEGKPATAPLLHVDYHIDRLFKRDYDATKISKTPAGADLCFHSLRHTYCSLVIESGASLTEAQRLMRHLDPKLTANVYSHARPDRLQSTAEAIGERVIPQAEYAAGMQQVAVGAESVDVNACDEKALAVVGGASGENFEPLHPLQNPSQEPAQLFANSPLPRKPHSIRGE